MPQNIICTLCAVILDHFKFASYGPAKQSLIDQQALVMLVGQSMIV